MHKHTGPFHKPNRENCLPDLLSIHTSVSCRDRKHGTCENIGIPTDRLPKRIYTGAAGSVTRYFNLKPPVAGGPTTTFVCVDPGNGTSTEMRHWGRAHAHVWTGMREHGITIHVAAIGVNPAADTRARAVCREPPGGGLEEGTGRNRRLVRTVLRAILFRSTYARYRIRHGIRHTEALAGRHHRPYVSNERLRYMLIGYARVSKEDGSQSLDLQRDALRAEGIDDPAHLYHDFASGVRDDRPGLDSCLRALRKGDVLVVWKLDRLGRNLVHLVNTVQDLSARGVGLRVLAGQGAQIDTTTAAGRLVFGIFAALAEFERELIRERTMAGLKAARARGRKGGRKFALSKAQVRLAQAAMAHRDTSVSELCTQLGIKPVTLYRYVGPQGQLREQGEKVLAT